METQYFSYSHTEYKALPTWFRQHLLSEYVWKVDAERTYFLFK